MPHEGDISFLDSLIISGAGHNDLMMVGQEQYFEKIAEFVNKNSFND